MERSRGVSYRIHHPNDFLVRGRLFGFHSEGLIASSTPGAKEFDLSSGFDTGGTSSRRNSMECVIDLLSQKELYAPLTQRMTLMQFHNCIDLYENA